MDISLPASVSINNSMPSLRVRFDPTSDPIAEPTSPPTTDAISDSVSDSVTFLPATPPIRAPATAPASLSPSIVTSVISITVPSKTYCCFWASDLFTTSGPYELLTQPEIIKINKNNKYLFVRLFL